MITRMKSVNLCTALSGKGGPDFISVVLGKPALQKSHLNGVATAESS
jgi:hypothetical protein